MSDEPRIAQDWQRFKLEDWLESRHDRIIKNTGRGKSAMRIERDQWRQVAAQRLRELNAIRRALKGVH